MPSTSLERRARVVTEIDKVRSSSLVWSSIRVKVVLPAPDGEERISIRPRPRVLAVCSFAERSSSCTSLLDILDLFAELLYLDAQFEAEPRQARVVRFGAQGIGFAGKFLGKEVEPAAGRAALRQKLAGRGGVRGKTVQFFPDIGLARQHESLLVQTILVEIRVSGKKSKRLHETRPDRLGLAGRGGIGRLRQRGDLFESRREHQGKRAALALPHGHQRIERLVEQIEGAGPRA